MLAAMLLTSHPKLMLPPTQLRALYAVDALLWAAALNSTCLCYRPPALPAAYMRNLHLLSDAELEDVEMRLMSCVW